MISIIINVLLFLALVVGVLVYRSQKHFATFASNQSLRYLAERDRRISELTERAENAERGAHHVIEQMRYVLEVAGDAGRATDAETIGTIGHVLPYVFSGRRHWNEPAPPESVSENMSAARRIALMHGFELPDNPVMAVASLLDVAAMLFNPTRTFPVEGWRNMHPVR
ncbi:TPA: hypothetical protein QDA91_004407 [Burkholderia vietnamiensis]|uniref:hypothetical protein n=1 Tax=Burkholderia vietnamiensis TaxID=60552 RepID=UPI000AFF2F9D|nr:hypothetical protein [Burkholderia vietnamiensis]HDR9133262.1 hypothetical protein [Burkholderia vietnamiensis]